MAMKKLALIHVEPLAAQPPIGAQQVMEAKQLMLRAIQRAFGDQHEVGDELFVLAAPHGAAAAGAGPIERNGGERFFLDSAHLKFLVADTEDRT